MKKVAIAILCVLSVASAQDKRFAFKGNAAQAGSGGISTATARQNTGWTSNGTLARDTLATNYAIFGAKTFGVGGTTQAQNARAKFNVIGRASPDTLAIIGNDGGGLVGDSTITIGPTGKMGIGVIFNPSFSLITGTHISSGGDYYTIGGYRISGATILSGTNPLIIGGQATTVAISPGSSGRVGIGTIGTGQLQAFLTVRPQTPTADTLFMARNDKNSTLDSTAIILKDGSFVTGEWRIRSGADSLVFHHDGVPVFAILPDGTTADLVAGVPPTLWRNGPPQEYIWLLRLGVLLLLLLVAFKVYDYAKPRIRKHQTLPGSVSV